MRFPSFVVRDSLNRPRDPRRTGRYVARQLVRGAAGEVVLVVATVTGPDREALRLVVVDGGPVRDDERAGQAA